MLIRHTLAYLPAQLLGPLVQFVTVLLLTHHLEAAAYGLTMLVFASQELVFLVCLSWWTTYVLRYAGTPAAGAPDLRATEGVVVLASSAVQAAATMALILAIDPAAPAALFGAACLFTLTRSYLAVLVERARQQAAIGAYTLLQVGAPAGGLAVTLLLLQRGSAGAGEVFLGFGLAQAVVAALVAWRFRLVVASLALDRDTLRRALAFGFPVQVSNGFAWFAGNGIRFVVQFGAGAAALGLLSVGWALATRLAAVTSMLVAAAAYPLAVRMMDAGDAAGARRQISQNSVLLLALIVPATFGTIAIAGPAVTLLVAPEYHAVTIAILPWALAGAAVRNLRVHGWDQLYLLCEAPRAMAVMDAIEAVLTLAGAAAGLALGGIEAAVIGATLAAFLSAGLDLAYLRARLGLVAPLGAYVRLLLAGALLYGAVSALPRLGLPLEASVASLAQAIVCGAAAYALALAMLFPAEVRRYGLRLLPVSLFSRREVPGRG